MNTEEWKWIGNSTDYMISNTGKVKSFVKNNTGGNILSPEVTKDGYARVMLRYPEKRTRHLVHRLVAIAFIENVDKKALVNHIDNNPRNNNVNNLEWCTYSENLIHAEKQGRLEETHDKAGQSTAKIMRERKLMYIESLIGSTINELTINGISSIEKKINSTGYTFFIKCTCTCGNSLITRLTNIEKNIVKMCTDCKSKTTIDRNYNNMKNSLIGSRYKHYNIVGIADFNADISNRHLLLDLKCTNCEHISSMKFSEINKKNRKHACKFCKHE